jgi:hypothetical protein
MAFLYAVFRGVLAFIAGIFHICAGLALLFGIYVAYIAPGKNSDPGSRIADSAIHAATESTEVVEKIGKWFADKISYDSLSKSNPRTGRALILVPEILIYFPAWAGAGVGGAIGGVIGDVAWHVIHRATQPAPANGLGPTTTS